MDIYIYIKTKKRRKEERKGITEVYDFVYIYRKRNLNVEKFKILLGKIKISIFPTVQFKILLQEKLKF